MADSLEIDLFTLHDRIKNGFKTQFPNAFVDCYCRPGEKIFVPAILFELESIEPADPCDTGTQQLEVELRFVANCIATYKQGGKLAVRLLAAQVAKCVKSNRWEMPVSPGSFLGAISESFVLENQEYESWCVSWSHTACLGESIWASDGILPEEVWIGSALREIYAKATP